MSASKTIEPEQPIDWRALVAGWPTATGWVFLAILAFCVLLAIFHGLYRVHADDGINTGFFFRLTLHVIGPFVTGMLMSFVLFKLMATTEWPFVTTLAALGVTFLLALIIIKDPSLSFLDQLKSASLAGVSLEFNNTRKPTTEDGAYAQESLDLGSKRIEYALNYLEALPDMIRRDQQYKSESGFDVGRDAIADTRELQFVKRIVEPTAKRIKSVRDRMPEYGSELIDHQLASHLREVADRSTKPDRRMKMMRLFFVRLDRNWRRFCLRDLDPKCKADRTEVRRAGHRFYHLAWIGLKIGKGSYLQYQLLGPNSPYGVLISSILLSMTGDDDAAIRDLHKWLYEDMKQPTPPGTLSHHKIGQLRVLDLQTALLMRRSSNPIFLDITVRRLERQFEIAREVMVQGKWSALYASFQDEGAKWTPADQFGCRLQATSVNFKRFVYAYVLTTLNNLVYYGTLGRDSATRWPTQAQNVLSQAELLRRMPAECLTGFTTAADLAAVRAATLDTHAIASLAVASNVDLPLHMRQKALCTALESSFQAQDAEARASRLAKRNPQKSPDEDFEVMESMAYDVVAGSLMRRRLRDIRKLGEALGAYEHCPGYRLPN